MGFEPDDRTGGCAARRHEHHSPQRLATSRACGANVHRLCCFSVRWCLPDDWIRRFCVVNRLRGRSTCNSSHNRHRHKPLYLQQLQNVMRRQTLSTGRHLVCCRDRCKDFVTGDDSVWRRAQSWFTMIPTPQALRMCNGLIDVTIATWVAAMLGRKTADVAADYFDGLGLL